MNRDVNHGDVAPLRFRDRLRARTARAGRRPLDLAAEVRVLAVGLFAVAAAAFWLNRSQAIAPAEVAGAALVIVAVFGVNLAVGVAGLRRSAREQAAAELIES